MKHYKMLKETQNSYELHDLRDNKTFHVAKSGLDDKMHAKFKKLPLYMAEGGEVPDTGGFAAGLTPTTLDVSNPLEAPKDTGYWQNPETKAGVADYVKGLPEATPPALESLSSVTPQDQITKTDLTMLTMPTPPPPTGASGVNPFANQPQQTQTRGPDILSQMKGFENKTVAAIGEKAKVESDMYNKQAAGYTEYQDKMKAFNDGVAEKNAAIEKENDRLYQETVNAKIDPNHYWNNHSRVSAAIGVMLSGLGQGLMKSGSNMALDFINKRIEDDISAQKDDLGKRQSLLTYNLSKYKDIRLAQDVTRQQMGTMFQAELAKGAAQANSPIAAANATIAIQGLKQQGAAQRLQMSQSIAQMEAAKTLASGGGSAQGVNMELLPEALRERVVPLDGGRLGVARNPGEAKDLRDTFSGMNDFQNKLAKVKTFMQNKGGNFALWPTQDKAEAAALNNDLLMTYNGMSEGIKRLTGIEISKAEGALPKAGDWVTSAGIKGLDTLSAQINDRKQMLLKNKVEGYEAYQPLAKKPFTGK